MTVPVKNPFGPSTPRSSNPAPYVLPRSLTRRKLPRNLNVIEESSIIVKVARQKRHSLLWGCFNFIVLAALYLDAVERLARVFYLIRLAVYTVRILCCCNIAYHAYRFHKARSLALEQKHRIRRLVAMPETSTPVRETFEFVTHTPLDATQAKTYWSEFESIFDTFKEMASNCGINVHPSPIKRSDFDESFLQACSESESRPRANTKYAIGETVSKYKGKVISTARDLKQYLFDYHKAEQDEFVKNSEDSSFFLENSSEFWAGRRRNVSDNVMDISPLLRRSEYQTSSNSSDSSICSTREVGCTNQEFYTLLWDKFKIPSSFFIYWISNFRMWVAKTVLGRIIAEINVADNGLRPLGLSGLTIGSVSLETLTDASKNPMISHHLPSLNFLLPFLRISARQQYVVERIRTLSQGSGMSDYKWNSGGEEAGKPWERGLPTDAELLIHIVSTYLDLQLPLSPANPDSSRPFSNYYVAKEPKAVRQTKLVIVQQSADPPHYNLVINDVVQEVPAGRNNLFYAIILFLYHIKTNENGMLGRVSLGRQGLNMLWIIDEKDM